MTIFPLQTERLDLYPAVRLGKQQRCNYQRLFEDEHIWDFYFPNVLDSQLAQWEANWSSGSILGNFYVIKRKSQEFVGSIWCVEGTSSKCAEIAFAVIRTERQKGFAKEMVKEIVERYLPTHDIEQVEAIVSGDSPSTRILTALGFEQKVGGFASHFTRCLTPTK